MMHQRSIAVAAFLFVTSGSSINHVTSAPAPDIAAHDVVTVSCGGCWNYQFWSTYSSTTKHKFRSNADDEQNVSAGLLQSATTFSAGATPSPLLLEGSDEPSVGDGSVRVGPVVVGSRGVDEEGWESAGSMNCQAFNSCHSDEQAALCADYHWACGVSNEHQAVFKATIDAPSALSVQKLAKVLPNRVLAVAERGILQVLDCKGAVIAQAPASPRVIADVARLVARTE